MAKDYYRGIYYDATWADNELNVFVKVTSLIKRITVNPQYVLFDPVCVQLVNDHCVHMTLQEFNKMTDCFFGCRSWSYNGLKVEIERETEISNGEHLNVDLIRGTVYNSLVFSEDDWFKMIISLQFVCNVYAPHKEENENDK